MLKGFAFFLHQGWKHDKRYILYLFMGQLTNAVTPIAAALLPKVVLDELTSRQRMEYLILYVVLFSGWLLLSRSFSVFFEKACFTHRCRVDAAFGFEMHERLARADFESLESPAFHDMKAKAQKFLTCDYHGFGYLLDCGANILGQVMTICGMLAILSTMEIWFVVLFAVLAVAASIIESRAIKNAMALSMEVVKNNRQWMYYSELFEQAKYGKEIRQNNMAQWLLDKEKRVVGNANQNIERQNHYYIASGVKRAGLTFIQQCAAYGLLIVKVLAGRLSIGTFTMCISAVTSFSDAMRGMMDRITEIRAYDFYYEQLDEYLHVPQTLRLGAQAPIPAGAHRFEFRNVGFRYQGAATWALRNINIVIEPGQHLALVGENGSGKTTLIKLLCRMYAPTEGVILMDGKDISIFDYDKYMELIATVFQDFQMFDCSVRDNILLGRTMEEARLHAILNQVGLAPRIASLRHGVDATVGRRFDNEGFEPSGGETQKIALARALCKDASIIILDEPTAAMDARAEYELYCGFDGLVRNKTAVYISHRMSVCRFCDRIAVLHQGNLIEYGTHDELMAHNGQYAELYALQAHYYID